ncbi:MAG: tRNA (adenosine(37)-N6)-threonylcarbamoyltransferase complex dimerization subunit type 1 TsaB [Flavobacterium sp.]|nr:tRNA (adenosine(37)-N6)-threonylcarbamoyltransferase complex dimerization subunit type 1 TsaB [Flavobacterium sp.]
MSLILNIETATKNCSVSLSNHGEVIACVEIAEQGYSHAEKLHVFIEQILLESGVQFRDLKAIAVSQGPGSYTGLRIGISAAKGLCYSLDIPLIAIDTLEVLARKLQISEGYIIPMIDARRMEVYSAVFNAQYQKIRDTQAEIITEISFSEYKETLHFVGDSTEKCKAILIQSNFVFEDEIVFPSANEMSRLSFEKYQKGDTVDVAYFEPYYLKDFIPTTPKK